MLLIFFHEKYQGLNVVLSDFRGLEKYRQYRENHWKQGWWEDKERKPPRWQLVVEKQKNIIYLKTYGAQWSKLPGRWYYAYGMVFDLWHSFVTY